jgi:hypothetical protein
VVFLTELFIQIKNLLICGFMGYLFWIHQKDILEAPEIEKYIKAHALKHIFLKFSMFSNKLNK